MKPEQAEKLLQLCSKNPLAGSVNSQQQHNQQRSQHDIWFIRDRLHECSSFFKLWPSQLQLMLAQLLEARQWVQHEVLAAAGSRPCELCFIIQGQAAVAVREAPGSSLLKDVALLHAGDTFGELCLLGVKRQPVFVVARSPLLDVLTVSADTLAHAMKAAPQQGLPSASLVATTAANSTATSSTTAPPAIMQQQDTSTSISSVSVDALYQLIGEPRGPPKAALSAQQALAVRQLHSRQLQQAAAAEASTVGTWQQLPHQRLGAATAASAARTTPPLSLVEADNNPCLQQAQEAAEGCEYGAVLQTDSTGGAKQQQQQQGQTPPFNSPLMHHAAIMHYAALKASAPAGVGVSAGSNCPP